MTAPTMAEQEYFKSALSDFTYEAASGGAIRHLADLGYTVKQICEQLSFPTPYARVQKTVWQRLLDTGILLVEEPGSGTARQPKNVEYVMERDKFGRTSFRLTASKEGGKGAVPVCWKERSFEGGERAAACPAEHHPDMRKEKAGIRKRRRADGSDGRKTPDTERGRRLAVYLAGKCGENDGEAYISCRFALLGRQDPAEFAAVLAILNERQREYVTGLPWEAEVCYHRLDQRMQEIAARLYGAGKLQEVCYFMKTGEKVAVR